MKYSWSIKSIYVAISFYIKWKCRIPSSIMAYPPSMARGGGDTHTHTHTHTEKEYKGVSLPTVNEVFVVKHIL